MSHQIDALDHHHTLISQVPSTRCEKTIAQGAVGCVDEVAREKDAVERFVQTKRFDVGKDGADARMLRDALEHVGRLIDGNDAVAKRHELARDAPGAASQLKHQRSGRQRFMDQTRLFPCRQNAVHRDGIAVWGDG